MATQYDTQIQQLYVAYFNRPADAAGIAHWANYMATAAGTDEQKIAQISAAFAQSLEYQVEYSQSTNAGIVNAVYENLFGRPAETEGLAFWVKALNDKTMTVDNMVDLISKGAQGTDKIAFDSKVVVAVAFTNALDTDAEKAGYSGADANEAAKALLATIETAAQATAAIEKTALDASVAAVIKASVPFTLEGGLAALTAANAAVETFFKDFAKANDLKTADADTVAAAVAAAQGDLVTLVEDEGYAAATAGVKAAMIADQEELNADTLEAANKALKTTSDAVAKVTGLGNAIAAAASAEASVEGAEAARVDAQAVYSSAQITLIGRNPNVTLDTTTWTIVDQATGKTIAALEDGELQVADGVTASNYVGLTAFVNAANGWFAANENVEAAEDAADLAQLRVELLDQTAGTLATAFTFTETTPKDAAKPTFNEIVNELSALTAVSVTADAAVAAADPLSTGYGALVTAAGEARDAVEDFKIEITTFNSLNGTKLADDYANAQEGTLVVAQDAVAEINGLAAAIAAKAALEAVTAVQTAANEALVTQETAFTGATANADLVIDAADGTVDYVDPVDSSVTPIIELNGNVLRVVAGTDVSAYAGVEDYITAFNAVVAADKAVADAALTGPETTLLSNNSGLVAELEAAQIAATSTDMATRVEALGTEGAQAAIDALAEARGSLEDAQATATELKGLQDDVKEAQADFVTAKYSEPVLLGVSGFGTTESDIFVATEVNSTVTNFGGSGDDVLFVGAGYSLNEGKLADGNDAALEVFFTQKGNNAVITIESKVYGSDSGDVHTVTLTGVSIEDLTFENGIITL